MGLGEVIPGMDSKVSVIIPVFNGERFIKECLNSVLKQTYRNIEIIVIDDGSTDNTKGIVINNFPSVTYFYQNNSGPASARNVGLKNSNGRYVAFLDSDDIWLPEKISEQVKILLENPEIKVVHTDIKLYKDGNLMGSCYPTEYQERKMFENLLLNKGSVVCSTVLVEREYLKKIGYFDEDLITAEDVHLFLRLAYYYDFYFIRKAYVIKRHHEFNLTNINNIHFGSGTIKALEKIEKEFPQYTRETSHIMRQAFFIRLRLRGFAYSKTGDYKNAMQCLLRAFKYNKAPSVWMRIIYGLISIFLHKAFSRFFGREG